eukprot:Nitzschia sp. Nitz4//scaffold144_size56818//1877//2980//NITZ4_006526-RA/size56818-processed-gene-0.75-mRNA-1//-1//CDS//3329536483//7145//frame0
MYHRNDTSTMILGRHHRQGDRLDVECCYLSENQKRMMQESKGHRQQRVIHPPSAPKYTPSQSSARVESRESESVMMRKRQLWRGFRRRMRMEQQEAVARRNEDIRRMDSSIQKAEQRRELRNAMKAEPWRWSDPCESGFGHELVLTEDLTKGYGPGYGSGSSTSSSGSFWNLFNHFVGKNEDTDTTSTADSSGMDDDASLASYASWQSWQSGSTARVNNCGRQHREMLLDHYGGGDDPWSAARRGDLQALEQRWKNRHDWTLEDRNGNTPLYYACQSGGARDLRVVLFLLKQWPSTQHIPEPIMESCQMDAANEFVAELLRFPDQAERIIQDFEENEEDFGNDHVLDFIEENFLRSGLYGISETVAA